MDMDIEKAKILLEQYKLYVEMADRVSTRRHHTNLFYISIISALIAFLSLAGNKLSPISSYQPVIYLSASVLGLLLCGIWYMNIESYRQLNRGKFKIIHEMEEKLPFKCYKEEWKVLGEGRDYSKYRQLTVVEKKVPLILSIPFLVMFAFSVNKLILEPIFSTGG